MSFISRLITISNTRTSSGKKLDIEENVNCSPVTELRTGDLIDSPNMLDLVVKVEHLEDSVRVTTNAGTTDHPLDDTVHALRRTRDERTGDFNLEAI